MDPGTAAILTLSAITGVSGYGAYKLNARRGASIDEEVQKAVKDAQAMIKASEDAKVIAEQALNKQNEDVKRLTNEINGLKKAKQQLLDEKVVLSKNLESATELEKTYRELTPEVFKQAIMDFKDNPKIKELGHPEFFDPLLSRFSATRGTARALYAKFKTAVTVMMPKTEFDTLLLNALKNGKSSLEQLQKKEAEAAEAKAAAKAAAKAKAATEAQAKRQAEAEGAAIRQKAEQEAALTNARERVAARNIAIEKAARDKAEAQAYVKRTAAEAKAEADAYVKRAADEAKIAKEKAAQEKGALTLRTPTGGMRKKKLRTRRGGKQNDRRTRRSKNRSNRSHPNAG
jgi:hypothetical protein